MKRLYRFVLQQGLRSYLKRDIQLEQFDIQWSQEGKLELHDLQLDEDAVNTKLAESSSPVRLVAGTLKTLVLTIPYADLLNEDVVVSLDDVELVFVMAEAHGGAADATAGAAAVAEVCGGGGEPSSAAAAEAPAQPASFVDLLEATREPEEGLGFLAKWMEQISSHIQLSISNLHVWFDGPPGAGSKLGLSLPKIMFQDKTLEYYAVGSLPAAAGGAAIRLDGGNYPLSHKVRRVQYPLGPMGTAATALPHCPPPFAHQDVKFSSFEVVLKPNEPGAHVQTLVRSDCDGCIQVKIPTPGHANGGGANSDGEIEVEVQLRDVHVEVGLSNMGYVEKFMGAEWVSKTARRSKGLESDCAAVDQAAAQQSHTASTAAWIRDFLQKDANGNVDPVRLDELQEQVRTMWNYRRRLQPSGQPCAQLELTFPTQYEKAKGGEGASPPPFASSVNATAVTSKKVDGQTSNDNMTESIYFDAEDDDQGASMMTKSTPLDDQLQGKRPGRYGLLWWLA